MSTPAKAYIGLGSNLSDPLQQLLQAVQELSELPHTQKLATSRFYRTPPMGPQDQPDYLNAVVGLETSLSSQVLLEHLQAIEKKHQRERRQVWGPRTLDLDILLYGDESINTSTLTVPHPGLKQRIFVVKPLFDIAPDLVLPDGQALKAVLEQLQNEPIELFSEEAY